jgi:hypothetical protein
MRPHPEAQESDKSRQPGGAPVTAEEPAFDSLTIEQITAIIEIGRGSCSDAQARVPPGTLATVVARGYAKAVRSGALVGYAPTPEGQAKAKEWLKTKTASQRVAQASSAKLSRRAQASSNHANNTQASNAPVSPRGGDKLPPAARLTALKPVNPSRPGSNLHRYYDMVRESATVGEYVGKGGNKTSLAYFIERGHVSIASD